MGKFTVNDYKRFAQEDFNKVIEIQREKFNFEMGEDKDNYTHIYEDGTVEEYDTKKEYVEYIFNPLIHDLETEIRYYQEKISSLNYQAREGVLNA